MPRARLLSSAAVATLCVGSLVSASACVFELAPLTESTASGGGGAGGTSGPGGMGGTATGSQGGGGSAGYRVTIDARDGVASSAQTEVPVLVLLDDSRIDYGLAAADGSDLRFFGSDGSTPLPHEVERWNPSATSVIWVRLPLVEPLGGSFEMRFGDPDAPSAPDPEQVWSRYLAVYHFAGAGTEVRDSAGGLDGIGASVTSAPGQIGDALSFGGAPSRIDLPDAMATFDVDVGQARTASIWFQRAVTTGTGMALFRTKRSCCSGWRFSILGDQFANTRFDIATGNCCTGVHTGYNVGPFNLPGFEGDVDWHRLTAVMNRVAGSTTVYLDGQLQGSSSLADSGDMIGADVAFGVSEYDDNWMVGLLDEARVAPEAFSEDWVTLTLAIANDQLLDYGDVERR